MLELLHAHADGAFATWDKNFVGLRELGLEQAIKGIGNLNLQ
jgi:hypothetical protein